MALCMTYTCAKLHFFKYSISLYTLSAFLSPITQLPQFLFLFRCLLVSSSLGFLYGSSFLASSFHFCLLLLEVIIASVMWIMFISFTISLFHNIKMKTFLVFLIKVSFFSCFHRFFASLLFTWLILCFFCYF